MEANLDARATECRCCGDELASKDGQGMCIGCLEAGCEPGMPNQCRKLGE